MEALTHNSSVFSPFQAAVPAAPLAVPSVPGAASAKGAQTSAAAVPETHSSCWERSWGASVQCMSQEVETVVQ
jgi:hypothetical protein